MVVSIGVALLGLALVLLFWAIGLRRRAGLPWAPVLAHDTGAQPTEKPLYSRRLGLTGRPDYLIERGGRAIPVEIKPGRQATRPYESDLMQLAAYCLLIEDVHGVAPPYGLLRYAQHTFKLEYTDRVRAEVLALLDEMRAAHEFADCPRSHAERQRCLACGFSDQCDESLG